MHPPRRGVQLHYGLGPADLAGCTLDHPMFDVLVAIDERGSLRLAALALGMSYRHVWGQLKAWELELGAPLVAWSQGSPAHLTPFAERLVAAERRARTRMAPHLDAMRSELQHVLAHALDTRPAVLRVACLGGVVPPARRDALAALAAERHELHLLPAALAEDAEAWWHGTTSAPPVSAGPFLTIPSHREAKQDVHWSVRAADAESPGWLRLQDLLASQAWLRACAA